MASTKQTTRASTGDLAATGESTQSVFIAVSKVSFLSRTIEEWRRRWEAPNSIRRLPRRRHILLVLLVVMLRRNHRAIKISKSCINSPPESPVKATARNLRMNPRATIKPTTLNANEIKKIGQYPPGIDAASPPKMRNKNPAARYNPPRDVLRRVVSSDIFISG